MMNNQAKFAATAWEYALALCLRSLPDGPECEAVRTVAEDPTAENVRAMLSVARCKPWATMVDSALIEIGLAALDDVLREGERHE